MTRKGCESMVVGRKNRAVRALFWVILFLSGVVIWNQVQTRQEEKILRQTEASTSSLENDTVLLGGMPVGIYMETDGVMVLNTEKIEGIDGNVYEPAADRVKTGDYITRATEEDNGQLRLRVERPGGGIVPMLVTTIYMILLSLLVAAPIGIFSAVYLIEYAKPGKIMTLIHFAIENLAGIPSIIYGLFGCLFFVRVCHFQYSLLAGALTLSIMLLPTIITTTEESLKAIPRTYRESSLGLGATKLQTVTKVVLPNALPGILVAVLLAMGRIVGESAALLLTAGTVASIPTALWGNAASGATLTIKMYTLMKEENDLTTACAIGIVLLVIVIVLNFASKMITKKLMSKKGE